MNNLDRFKSREIRIDDMEFIIQPFHAREAYRLKFVLLEKFGPSLSTLIGSINVNNKSILDSNIDAEKAGVALSILFQKLDEEEADKLTLRLLKTTEAIGNIDGTQKKILLDSWDNIDKLFRKRLSKVYVLIWEIIKENYGDFFQLMEGIGEKIKATGLLKDKKN